MSLILIQTIVQSVGSTIAWFGFCIGIRALPGSKARQWRWTIGSAVVAAVWLIGVFLLGAANVFRSDVLTTRIAITIGATLFVGYILLLPPTSLRISEAVP